MLNVHNVTKCCVIFYRPSGEVEKEICFEKKAVIDDLILHSIKAAKQDLTPAKYVILGHLKITLVNGSHEVFSIFEPWGHYAHNDKYFVTDFSGLKAACEKELPRLRPTNPFAEEAKIEDCVLKGS